MNQNPARICRLWDKDWTYTPKDSTDIRKLFAKVRQQNARAVVSAIREKKQ